MDHSKIANKITWINVNNKINLTLLNIKSSFDNINKFATTDIDLSNNGTLISILSYDNLKTEDKYICLKINNQIIIELDEITPDCKIKTCLKIFKDNTFDEIKKLFNELMLILK